MVIPSGFKKVTRESTDAVEKGDDVLLIYSKPWWIPSFLKNIAGWILQYHPAIKRVTIAQGGEYHNLKFKTAEIKKDIEDDKDYIYLYFEMSDDSLSAGIIVALIAGGAVIIFLTGYLAAVAIRKESGRIGQSIFTFLLLAVAVTGLGYIGGKALKIGR